MCKVIRCDSFSELPGIRLDLEVGTSWTVRSAMLALAIQIEKKMAAALKWFVLRGADEGGGGKATLEIGEAATELLETETRSVNCVAICGEVRTGKSYLLNALARGSSLFGVDHNIHSFTTGVDIAPRFYPLSEVDSAAAADAPRLLFCDCEGQDNHNMSFDLKLVTPLLLVAKVVIMNVLCGAGPPKEKILSRLQLMVHAAKQIERSARAAIFGHLHLVLRDCRGEEAECRELVFGMEDPEGASTDDEEEAIARRNAIRRDINKAFESAPTVWCTPRILDAPPNYEDAGAAYVAKVDEIRAAMVAQLAEPKRIDGVPLTGRTIAQLLPRIREVLLEDNPAFSPPSTMSAIRGAMARRACLDLSAKR